MIIEITKQDYDNIESKMRKGIDNLQENLMQFVPAALIRMSLIRLLSITTVPRLLSTR